MKNEQSRYREGVSEQRAAAMEGIAPSDRSLEQYRQFLGFRIEDLRRKQVLDIGSGIKRVFADEASQHAVEVTSLDPQAGNEAWQEMRISPKELDTYRERLREDFAAGRLVVGIAQELPFRKEAFDAVTALYSVPMYLPEDISEVRKTFFEIARVLKPGGRAYLYPVMQDAVGKFAETVFEELRERGFQIVLAPLDLVETEKKFHPQRVVIEKPL